ncbi:hypothetical protein V6N13_061229 [Hibiscus sabdariffa]|uniref:Uncharacterized protein n=1 Tax=Hibiscus sabdariffa TaxID=183260 RepID=A0ABR2EG10_9ROSI
MCLVGKNSCEMLHVQIELPKSELKKYDLAQLPQFERDIPASMLQKEQMDKMQIFEDIVAYLVVSASKLRNWIVVTDHARENIMVALYLSVTASEIVECIAVVVD